MLGRTTDEIWLGVLTLGSLDGGDGDKGRVDKEAAVCCAGCCTALR